MFAVVCRPEVWTMSATRGNLFHRHGRHQSGIKWHGLWRHTSRSMVLRGQTR